MHYRKAGSTVRYMDEAKRLVGRLSAEQAAEIVRGRLELADGGKASLSLADLFGFIEPMTRVHAHRLLGVPEHAA